jgi:hypothetical protein
VSGHTPGPWVVDAENQLQINNANGGPVAWTETCVGYEKDSANARLIAAAPELLTAAREALSGMDGGEDHSMCHTGICSRGECSQCQRVDGLRRAIAKAEGK